jgi:hypothetical protein
MEYDKSKALEMLQTEVGYKPYGRKHGESRFTKFFQNYYLPNKFGIDKRRAHISSEILSGLKTRDEALKELEKPLYGENELQEDKAYIAKKLGFSEAEFDEICAPPGVSYAQYKNWDGRYRKLKKLQNFIQKTIGRNISTYGY